MTPPIQSLHAIGQSLWYDNIRRCLLENGELATLIERGELRGMTSNPSIFNQAIARSNDYDVALASMAWAGYSAEQILDRLVVEDIRAAADLFLSLYRETEGRDGFVSVEVSPALAKDTEGTLDEALRLWEMIDRPNLMVKIPATLEGIPAIRQAIAAGLNINITLIFSLARYKQVMDAYLEGLEARLEKGLPLDGIASVASFFVSRIDSKIDKKLEAIVREETPEAGAAAGLRGKLAITNAKLAYAQFRSVFESERFERLKEYGARVQRPLWASTSTKNPAYPDTMYVDELIGPDTVNTVPPQTLDAFRDHGKARLTVEKDLPAARKAFEELEPLGISMDEVTRELEEEGVKAFADAFSELMDTVEQRRLEALGQLGPLAAAVEERLAHFKKSGLPARLWANDPTLWTADPEGQREIRKRMGWLGLPERSREMLPELRYFADGVQSDAFTNVLLLGMGGSSLAPEVMSKVFSGMGNAGQAAGWLDVDILDSTDPGQVMAAATRSPVERTLYIVSSKSGTTSEVNAFLNFFWEYAQRTVGNHAADHFIAITDPGTPLDKLADERSFRRIFHADSKVGGRFSALTAFGLVPAALMGLDAGQLLSRAAWMARQATPEAPVGRNPGIVLGAVLGEAALHGRDKLTIVADPALASFGSWLEQLVAESSGKQGTGIVPVDGEPLGRDEVYGDDRIFVHLRLQDSPSSKKQAQALDRLKQAGHPVLTFILQDGYDLGAEFYRWAMAVAVACTVLAVNAFDQPDVQDNKARTEAKIKAYHEQGALDEGQALWEGEGVRLYAGQQTGGFSPIPGAHSLRDWLSAHLAMGKTGDYVALNAYLPRNAENEALLEAVRTAVRQKTRLATTVGFGPRFLHSTGQLHKGGPDKGLFVQITADPHEDIEIPGMGLSFSVLERAQALGDFEALQARGRRVLRVHLPDPRYLKQLLAVFETL